VSLALYLLIYLKTRAEQLVGGILTVGVALAAAFSHTGQINSILATSNKLAFGMLLLATLRQPKFLQAIRVIWIWGSLVITVSTLLYHAIVISGLMSPNPVDTQALSLGNYPYQSIWPLGFSMIKMEHINRVTWFIAEPGQLSLLFAYNTVCADLLVRTKKNRLIFLLLTVFAGIGTFSVTFFIHLFIFAIYKAFKLSRRKISLGAATTLMALTLFSLAALCQISNLWEAIFLKFSSLEDRIDRLNNAIHILSSSSLDKLLFGHGINYIITTTTLGSSNALADLLVERGLLVFVLIFSAILSPLFRAPCYAVLLIVALFAFPCLWWPCFWLAFALFVSLQNANLQNIPAFTK
jgi:hypothetical protein